VPGERQAAVFRDGGWILVPDFRGHEYWLPNGRRVRIKELGVEPPAEALDVAPPPTLDEVRADKLKELADAFGAEFYGSVNYAGTQFQADAESARRLNGVLSAFTAETLPVGFYWLDSRNAPVVMDYAALQGLARAMADRSWAAFQKLQDRKAAVRTALTAAEVQAITW
jgi:hypothetical protein